MPKKNKSKSKSGENNLVDLTNFYKFTKKKKTRNPGYDNHLIQIPFYMGVIGSGGSGKGIFLMELIKRMNNTFEEIIVCLRDKNEPLYEYLDERGGELVKFFENRVPSLDDEMFAKEKQRLIIFDDLILDRKLQPLIGEYFVRSRKKDFSCIYVSQTYYGIPKIIRQQFHYIVLKRLGTEKDIKMIIKEYALGMDIDNFISMYEEATKDKLGFLLIDMVNHEYKFRYCFKPIQF